MPKRIATVVQPLDNARVERVIDDITESIRGVDADALPTEPTMVAACVQQLQRYSDAVDRIGQSKGEAMLLAGMALLNIWETIPDKGNRMWLEDNKIKHSWAYEAMAFAKKAFTREQARELGWRGMRAALKPDEGENKEKGGGKGEGSKKKWATYRDLEMKLLAAESALICVQKGLSKAEAREILADLPKAKALFKSARKILCKGICDKLAPVEVAICEWEQRIRDRECQKDETYNEKMSVKNATKDLVSLRGR